MNYTAKIKGFDHFESSTSNDIKLTPISENEYVVNLDGHNYNAMLLESDFEKKQFQFNINGRIIDITMEDDLDRLIEKMEFNKGNKEGEKMLKSPMPGVILSIDKAVGEEVSIGDKLFTLEAMKMENIIKSSVDGVVQSIDVNLQDAVEKGQLLLNFE